MLPKMATFMDVAAETRMQIYEEMFVPRGEFWLRSYQGNHERGQYLKVAYSEYRFNTAILRVCKKVYHEAIVGDAQCFQLTLSSAC